MSVSFSFNSDSFETPDPAELSGWYSVHRLPFTIYAKGSLLLPPFEAGEESLRVLAERLDTYEMDDIITDCEGIFCLAIFDNNKKTWSFSVDNLGLYRLYYSKRSLSHNFLKLFDDNTFDSADIENVIEFLLIGYVRYPNTICSSIKRLAGNEILHIDKHGTARIRNKNHKYTIRHEGLGDFFRDEFVRRLPCFDHLRPSFDLTGGMDSRLLACAADVAGMKFDVALSAQPTSRDAEIARRVAAGLGRRLLLSSMPGKDFDSQLEESMIFFGAQVHSLHAPRNHQLALQRIASGNGVMVHGGGGVILSDQPFAHAFPFYKKKVSLSLLLKSRYIGLKWPSQCTTDLWDSRERRFIARNIQLWKKYENMTNAEACPRVYYYEKAPDFYGPFLSAYTNAGLAAWAPFLERWCAHPAFALPVREKLFRLWHRKQITRLRPDIARIETTDGCSASSEPLRIFADLPGIGLYAVRRLVRKIVQRQMGRSLLAKPGTDTWAPPEWSAWLRHSEQVSTAIRFLQKAGVFSSAAHASMFEDIHLGRLATLGFLLRRKAIEP